jgi:hypothetical protein
VEFDKKFEKAMKDNETALDQQKKEFMNAKPTVDHHHHDLKVCTLF